MVLVEMSMVVSQNLFLEVTIKKRTKPGRRKQKCNPSLLTAYWGHHKEPVLRGGRTRFSKSFLGVVPMSRKDKNRAGASKSAPQACPGSKQKLRHKSSFA
jgi:hypothetical protein